MIETKKNIQLKTEKESIISDEKSKHKILQIGIENNDSKNNIKYTCDWKRVCGVDQIRRVVEHLGENLQDQELRNSLVTSLLADRKVTDCSG